MLERVLVALLAGGHVLLEGVPGLAKTLTVRTLAGVLGGSYSRVQFTPDLVPADLVGTRIWQPDRGEFRTELGPVFANLLLADEINRAPAKVQSALLEVMQEHQVTIGGTAHPRAASRSSCSPRRTRSSPRAPTRCPRPRSTASSSSSSSTTRRSRTRSPSCAGWPASRSGRAHGARDGRPAALPDRGAGRARRPDRRHLRGPPRRRDPPPGRARPRRHRAAASSTARARARRSASSRPPRRSRCCAAATT